MLIDRTRNCQRLFDGYTGKRCAVQALQVFPGEVIGQVLARQDYTPGIAGAEPGQRRVDPFIGIGDGLGILEDVVLALVDPGIATEQYELAAKIRDQLAERAGGH